MSKELNLGGYGKANSNKISDFEQWMKLESSRTALNQIDEYKGLDLSSNRLNRLPNFRSLAAFKCLQKLVLWGNPLQEINAEYLPETLITLDLEQCSLRKVTSLKCCTHLQNLSLAENKLVTLPGLPASLKKINFDDNPIEELKKESVPDDQVFAIILDEFRKNKCKLLSSVKQPPPELIKRGFHEVQDFFTAAAHSELLRNSRNRLIMVGPSMAGKTSLTSSLINGQPSPTSECERTKVMDIKVWQITDSDTYNIYDQGGHDIYSVTNPVFISTESTVLMHSNILDDSQDMKETLQKIMEQQPKSDIYFILTHIDQLIPSEAKTSIDNGDIQALVKNEEIYQLIKNQESFVTKKQQFMSDLEHFIKGQIDNLNRFLTKVEDKANGKYGGDPEGFDSAKHVLECYQKLQNSLDKHFFAVSNVLYFGIEELREALVTKATDSRVKIPKEWAAFFTSLNQNGTGEPYYPIATIKAKFEQNCGGFLQRTFNAREIKRQTRLCLQYMHDCGTVFWKYDHDILQNYFFHKLEFIIEVFKCIFDHDLKKRLDFESSQKLQAKFEKYELSNEIKQLEKDGLLSKELLTLLIDDMECDIKEQDVDTIVHLMKSLGVCYYIDPNIQDLENAQRASGDSNKSDKSNSSKELEFDRMNSNQSVTSGYERSLDSEINNGSELVYTRTKSTTSSQGRVPSDFLFCPWFVKHRNAPEEFSISRPMIVNDTTVSLMLICEFWGHLPINVYEMLCVQVFSLAAGKADICDRQVWKDGLLFNDGDVQWVVYKNSENNTISFVVRCHSKVGISRVWKMVHFVHTSLDKILSQWHGVVKNRYMPCAHCVFHGIQQPCRRHVSQVFPTKRSSLTKVSCDNDPYKSNIPAALVFWQDSGAKKLEKSDKDVQEYLRDNWKDVPMCDRFQLQLTKLMEEALRPHFLSIMFPDPVIDQLFVAETISDEQKVQLAEEAAKGTTEVCAKLYDFIIEKESHSKLMKFRDALWNSGYHTNCFLAQMIPLTNNNTELDQYVAPDVLLSKEETTNIRTNFYEGFTDYCRLEQLIPVLYEENIITVQHKQAINNIPAGCFQKKAKYILDNVLLRGTYDTVLAFHSALTSTKQHFLAKRLVLRH